MWFIIIIFVVVVGEREVTLPRLYRSTYLIQLNTTQYIWCNKIYVFILKITQYKMFTRLLNLSPPFKNYIYDLSRLHFLLWKLTTPFKQDFGSQRCVKISWRKDNISCNGVELLLSGIQMIIWKCCIRRLFKDCSFKNQSFSFFECIVTKSSKDNIILTNYL